MFKRMRLIARLAVAHWLFVLALSVGFTLLYYTLQMGAMIVKFEQWPNYSTVYDWPTNVMRIIDSTPSLRDTVLIIKEEWLIEVGYMNYEYGIGISQWSLYLSPVKVLSVFGLGVMIALLLLLARLRSTGGGTAGCAITGGIGATAASVSLMSLSWVVCCATPSWVVGLAILGLSASTALWLAPIGIWLNVLGFTTLAVTVWVLADKPSDGKIDRLNDPQPAG